MRKKTLLLLALLMSMLIVPFTPVQADTFPDDWDHGVEITIDCSKIDVTLTNFPFLIFLNSSRVDFDRIEEDGADIRFTFDNSTLLNYEIELWDDVGEEAWVWVRGTLVHDSNTTLYLWYGNSEASDAQNVTGVWDDNYVLVHHMNGTSYTELVDSTSNDNDVIGEYSSPTYEQTGKIGDSVYFDGDAVNVTYSSSLGSADEFTWEVWFDSDVVPQTDTISVPFAKANHIAFNWGHDNAAWRQTVIMKDVDSAWFGATLTESFSTDTWYYITGRYNSTHLAAFCSGLEQDSAASTKDPFELGSHSFYIGATEALASWWNGFIDEIRISNISRSDAWIKTSYYSGNDELVVFGSQFGDTTKPVLGVKGTNSTVAGEPILFYANWSDNVELSHWFFRTNNTGTWISDETIYFSGGTWSNATKVLNRTLGITIGWRIYCYDTSDNLKGTGIRTLITTDETPPTYSNVGTNTTIISRDCLFHVEWDDNYELSHYIFGTNNTGTWVNETAVAFSGGTWSNVVKVLNETIHIDVEWCVWANDTSGNWNNTGIQSFCLHAMEIVRFGIDGVDVLDYIFYGEEYDFYLQSKVATFLRLTLPDGYTDMVVSYNNITGVFDSSGPINILNTDVLFSGDEILVRWTVMLDRAVIDGRDKNLVAYILGDSSYETETGSIDYQIYYLGGYASYDINGTANHVQGGDVFELNGTLGGEIRADVVWRRFQHLNMLFHLDTGFNVSGGFVVCPTDDVETGAVEFGVDYAISDEWVVGWRGVIEIVDGRVGTTSDDSSWVKLRIKWYQGNDLLKTDYLYSYHEGYSKDVADLGVKPYVPIWVDLWFNKINGSSVVGGRVNAYWHGMREKGTWWFGYGDFVPMIGNTTQSMFFANLKDDEGDIISSKELELMRVWMRLDACTNHTWALKDFDIMNWKTAGPEEIMEGVDTPIFVSTKFVDAPQTGFLAPLYQAISGIGKAVSKSLIGSVSLMMGTVDGILTGFGLPRGTFIAIMTSFGNLTDNIVSWLTYYTAQIGVMFGWVNNILIFVTDMITYVVGGVTWFVGSVLGIVTLPFEVIVAMLSGGSVTMGGWHVDFVDLSPMLAAVYVLAPLFGMIYIAKYLLGMDKSGDVDLGAIPSRWKNFFVGIRDLYKGVTWIFVYVKNQIISFYNFLRSHIPTIGGSGGLEEES